MSIHKNIDKLIEKAKEYDYKFHAKQIAEEYNLNVNDIIKIMEISDAVNNKLANALFNSYFKMLRDGIPLNDIVDKEKQRIRRQYNSVMNYKFTKRE